MRKSIFNISELLYRTLNIYAITNEISGTIYRDDIPLNDEKENIVILVNGVTSERNTGVQKAIAHVNISINDFSNGLPNISRFQIISDKVKSVLESRNQQGNKSFYYNILDETLFEDKEQNMLHFFSIKLKINT